MERSAVGLVIGQLHRGGAEKQLRTLALGLRADPRIRPVVYCLSDVVEPHGPLLQQAGVELRVLPAGSRSALARLRSLRAATREDCVRLLHAFLLGPAVQTALVSRGPRAPLFVASNRTCGLARPRTRRLLESWALNRARVVTVNSTAAIDFTERYYRVSRGKIHFIPNGLDLLGADRADPRAARRELDLPDGARVVLGLFRLSPEKDLECFCDVVEALLREDPHLLCMVAGDGPMRARLEARVAASPVAERFRLLGSRDDVPRLLAAADLMLLTSRLEGMPNGVLEAMGAGLPVVATRVGGVPDLIEDGASGFVCDVGDRPQLTAACRRVLDEAGLAAKLGAAAQARAGERFSTAAMVDAYRELYRTLLDGEVR